MNTVDKYYWVIDHPKLNNEKYATQPIIEITPHMVNPVTECIEEDDSLNTYIAWWIEVMVAHQDFNPDSEFPADTSFERSHDWNLDCGDFTTDGAIHKLYNLVMKHYGEY